MCNTTLGNDLKRVILIEIISYVKYIAMFCKSIRKYRKYRKYRMGKGQYQGGRLGSQGTYHPNNAPIGEVAGGMGSLQAEYFTVGHQ